MITNLTEKTIVSQQEKYCTSFWSQMCGLMFRKKKNLVMIFPTERKISLHSFFVFYPLEIVFADTQGKVLETYRLLPWSFWTSTHKGKYLIELALSESRVKEKNLLKIKK